MADFNSAFNKVIQYEGGYVNDPSDPGGETIKELLARFLPNGMVGY